MKCNAAIFSQKSSLKDPVKSEIQIDPVWLALVIIANQRTCEIRQRTRTLAAKNDTPQQDRLGQVKGSPDAVRTGDRPKVAENQGRIVRILAVMRP